MRRMLKYLLPFIYVVAFCGNADDSFADVIQDVAEGFVLDAEAGSMSFSADEQEFCVPRPTSIANTQRVQTLSRRTDAGQRQGFSFVKAGKVINAGIVFCTQNVYRFFPSGLSEPTHRLISLGKLII